MGNTEATSQASDIFAMSDDEILNMSSPVAEVNTQNTPDEDKNKETVTTEENKEVTTEVNTQTSEQVAVENKVEDASTLTSDKESDKVTNNEVDSNGTPITSDASSTQQSGQTVEDKDKQGETPKSDGLPTDFNYKAGYEKIMAPFKADGKMITPRSEEEAISLMQMGANYTRKMQELQPYRKVLLMLQNNGLLDEGKLSFLIDVDKKNPEAIKKLLVDGQINPLDIDTEVAPQYQEGNHRVSDDEAAFATELDDVKSTPEGQATLGIISKTWDDASKQALLENRGWLPTIHAQRENGMYDHIVNEMEHQRTLGRIPANTPFIQAYKAVGDYLAQQGAFGNTQPAAQVPPTTVQAPAAVATRVATPKPTVTHSQQASAASPSRNAPRKAEVLVNPLEMSDEDFMKLPRPQSR